MFKKMTLKILLVLITLSAFCIKSNCSSQEPNPESSPDENFPKFNYPFLEAMEEVDIVRDFSKFRDDTKKSEYSTILALYSKKNCFRCELINQSIREVVDRNKKYVRFAKFNCDLIFQFEELKGDIPQCEELYPSKLPAITIYYPEEYVYFPYEYHKPMTEK